MDSTMVNFAFFSLKTVIFHSGADNMRNLDYNQASLSAARSALGEVQNAREFSQPQERNSNYMRNAFAHS
jgi:hypothetical protein